MLKRGLLEKLGKKLSGLKHTQYRTMDFDNLNKPSKPLKGGPESSVRIPTKAKKFGKKNGIGSFSLKGGDSVDMNLTPKEKLTLASHQRRLAKRREKQSKKN